MNILVLGGTQFVGRHIVNCLQNSGHTLTMLNRGKTGEGLFPEISRIVGDRNDELVELNGRSFDAVVDCSGYRPNQIRRVSQALANKPYYLFISTISVYDDYSVPFIDEGSSLHDTAKITDPDGCPIDAENYGPLKVLCEQAVAEEFPSHGMIRPGLIMGPFDHTQRISYWPWRVQRGGKMAIPERGDQPFQGIDARDLAGLVLKFVGGQIQDVVNGVGPGSTTTHCQMLEACVSATGVTPDWVPMSESDQTEAGTSWAAVLPEDGTSDAIFKVRNDRAKSHGLTLTSLETTFRDVLDDIGSLETLKSGWSLEAEAAYLTSKPL